MRIVDSFDMRASKPLDTRFSVETLEELEELKYSVTSYDYMRVVCKQNGVTYELRPANDIIPDKHWEVFKAFEVGSFTFEVGEPSFTVLPNSEGKLDIRLTLPVVLDN